MSRWGRAGGNPQTQQAGIGKGNEDVKTTPPRSLAVKRGEGSRQEATASRF